MAIELLELSSSSSSQSEARRINNKSARRPGPLRLVAGFSLSLLFVLALASWTLYPPTPQAPTRDLASAYRPAAPAVTTVTMSKAIPASEVEKHTKADDAWVIIEGNVYDVSEFLEDHPGGKKVLLNQCGKDATEKFWQFHSKKILDKTAKRFLVGPVQVDAKL